MSTSKATTGATRTATARTSTAPDYRHGLYIAPELWAKMCDIGQREDRSINYLIVRAITEYVERHTNDSGGEQ